MIFDSTTQPGMEGIDPQAVAELLPLLYQDLRKLAVEKMAHEARGHTLQPTALVHEAYLRLLRSEKPQQWNSRGHFFAAAAEAMRRILIEQARRKKTQKRGGSLKRMDLDEVEITIDGQPNDIMMVDDALTKLAEKHPEKAELVKLRYFAGLTNSEAAQLLGISTTTADRYWTYARAWLFREIESMLA